MDKWAIEMTDMQNMTDLLSCSPAQLEELVLRVGEKKFRAKQIWDFLWKGYDICEMSNLPSAFRARLEEEAFVCRPVIEGKAVSKIDGTVKYLLRLSDGELIECVVMEYEHGTSICISTQAGCRMGCRFCASTIGGLVRCLEPHEILDEVMFSQLDSGKRISNIVLMGIGEPLDNYDNVMRFLRLVNCEKGMNIGFRHISLSTCGITERFDDLADEGLPITLSVSLHAPDDVTRSRLMPANRGRGVDRLIDCCRKYYDKTGRRISFEYAMIDGVNDTEMHARLLAKRALSVGAHLNLIPLNHVEERRFQPSTAGHMKAFIKILEDAGCNVTVRRKLGGDVDASCGQLRRKMQRKEQKL